MPHPRASARFTMTHPADRATRSTRKRIPVFLVFLALLLPALSPAQNTIRLSGTVLDPSGRPVAGAQLEFLAPARRLTTTTAADGTFTIALPNPHSWTIHVEAPGFAPITHTLQSNTTILSLQFERPAPTFENVIVTADAMALAAPDPSQKVLVREELLDANPGRPGAPVSIPGLPIETASGGIKAPQYFAPGVAGDHGEPIAQYVAIGGYLLPNNLSANAHGNGYADPNIYVSGTLASVTTDGGAYNVLEGNHALNLAATYAVRPRLNRFLTFTGDYRDADLTTGLTPANPSKQEWLALEANYGNGLMRTLEHRQQYKWNAIRVYDPGAHTLTLFSDGYYGQSHEGNLVPTGYGVQVNDTIDPRQQDQTHTSILAANDEWKASPSDAVAFAGFFRTYNLALFSDFGEGLIRQSEFRTVQGAETRATHTFRPRLEGMAGVLYNEDGIRNDNLDHYLSGNPRSDGAFVKVLANNVTLRELAPYAALRAGLGTQLRFYAGLRNDQIDIVNSDKMKPADSFSEWKIFENPKATVTWSPGISDSNLRWLPSASFSLGQAFFTEDPRVQVAPSATHTGAAALANPFERSHAEQLVLDKVVSATDLRVTLGRTTMTATSGKIDPDNGTAFDLGPSTLKFLTVSAGHPFTCGTLQAVFSKADARLATFNGVPGTVGPETPRTIFDALTTLDRLPLSLHARAEYEYVGHKFLDVGNPLHPSQYEAIPVDETRLALVRPFFANRLELGADGSLARGYAGQTTETFDPAWPLAASRTNLPYCAPGSGPSALPNDFNCGTVERAVGVRMVSWIGGSISWRFSTVK
jgi:hypothetical protein